ncbi:hypothetical protein B0H14DRAFT_3664648 [Mycena olivaceomarginata]|nr:hypothetical protein B0H14DRAFT_3664648 [Mycena olivaceomarginata]
MWTEGCWTRDVDVVEGAERIDVAVPIRLVDLRYKTLRSTTPTHTSSPLPTTLPSTQAARKLACLSSHQVSDIVQSIVLHTLQWSSGNSSATQIFMSVSALFNIEGHNGTGIVGLDFNRLWHPKTMEEIEKAYPRGDFYHQALAAVDREFAQKPNCLVSHFPGGLDGFTNEFRVGAIVLRHLDQIEGLDRGLQRAQ